MITTTTTAIATAFSAGLLNSLTLFSVVALVALLITKEISGSVASPRARRLSRTLNVALVPLLTLFGVALVLRLIDVLR